MQSGPNFVPLAQIRTRTRRFALLLFDGFSNLCLANAVEPLRAANMLARRPLYGWTHAGLDTGSRLLASAGLLDGYSATAHWELMDTLAETFPEVQVTESRHVIDRDRASCGGATTTLDLMLEPIERHHGGARTRGGGVVHAWRTPAHPEERLHLPPDRVIRAAAAVMRRNIESPPATEAVARRLGVSRRSLEAAFRSKAGQGSAALYRSIRLAEARRRLAFTTESIAQIALRSGYADAAAFARAFRAESGLPPRMARQTERSRVDGSAAAVRRNPGAGNPI